VQGLVQPPDGGGEDGGGEPAVVERLGLAKGFTHGPPLEHKTAIKLKWGDAAAADRLRDGSLLVICDEQDRADAKARAAVARAAAAGPGGTAQRPSSRQRRGEPGGVSFAFGGVGGGGARVERGLKITVGAPPLSVEPEPEPVLVPELESEPEPVAEGALA
jgi:hypothetical protein